MSCAGVSRSGCPCLWVVDCSCGMLGWLVLSAPVSGSLTALVVCWSVLNRMTLSLSHCLPLSCACTPCLDLPVPSCYTQLSSGLPFCGVWRSGLEAVVSFLEHNEVDLVKLESFALIGCNRSHILSSPVEHPKTKDVGADVTLHFFSAPRYLTLRITQCLLTSLVGRFMAATPPRLHQTIALLLHRRRVM